MATRHFATTYLVSSSTLLTSTTMFVPDCIHPPLRPFPNYTPHATQHPALPGVAHRRTYIQHPLFASRPSRPQPSRAGQELRRGFLDLGPHILHVRAGEVRRAIWRDGTHAGRGGGHRRALLRYHSPAPFLGSAMEQPPPLAPHDICPVEVARHQVAFCQVDSEGVCDVCV